MRFLIPLTLLALFWLVPRLAVSNVIPAGAEYHMWPPLKDDLHALNLRPADVRTDVYDMSYSGDNEPLHARYVLRGRGVAYLNHLNISNAWRAQGVPQRPARVRWSFRRSRPGKAYDCPQELAKALPRGRRIENAVLTWRERTPQGERQATLTVWRAVRASTSTLVCVESSRTLPGP